MKELDSLEKSGLLKAEPGEQSEFDGLLKSGGKKLADAQRRALSPESQFDLAYNAAHALSLAALRWHGYRSNNNRVVVFQTLQHTLGIKPEVWRILDKCHAARNLAEYEGHFTEDKRLIGSLVTAAKIIYEAVSRLGPLPAASERR